MVQFLLKQVGRKNKNMKARNKKTRKLGKRRNGQQSGCSIFFNACRLKRFSLFIAGNYINTQIDIVI